MFNTIKRAFGFAKRQPSSKYTLSFPEDIFDGGLSKERPKQRLTKCFPFASWLSKTITEKHSDLAAQIQGKDISDQYEIISRAAALGHLPKGGIEAVSLHLLIHLEQADLLKTIRENFPDKYQRAVEEQGGEISPFKFTVRLLEEFGIQNRTFPDCYDLLRTQVKESKQPRPSPQRPPALAL